MYLTVDREWQNLKDYPFFTVADVAAGRGIALPSAHVLCNRYVEKGYFTRLKKNFYVLTRNWERYGGEDFFRISNFLHVPSYISCLSALSFYGISTQVQQDWYEGVTRRRSPVREVQGVRFRYCQIKDQYYCGFVRREGYFIASPEKAFLDAAYLHFLGRYPLDWDSLDLARLDKEMLVQQMEPFSPYLKERIKTICKI